MNIVFIIEDEWHSEWLGQFDSLDAAVAELEHRAQLPWDQPPNQAPCTSWHTCGRRYELIEFDAGQQPWNELRRIPVFEVSATGVQWCKEFMNERRENGACWEE